MKKVGIEIDENLWKEIRALSLKEGKPVKQKLSELIKNELIKKDPSFGRSPLKEKTEDKEVATR